MKKREGLRKTVSEITRKSMENKTEVIDISLYNTVMYSYLVYWV